MIKTVDTNVELFRFLIIGETIYFGKNTYLAEYPMVAEPPKIQMTSC